MNKEGCVIIIEDDKDDQLIIKEVFDELNYANEVIFFENAELALEFLTNGFKNPFLILSDINLGKLNGFELREKLRVDAALHLKCIPYLFFTTQANQKAVKDAYSISVQGFFTKPGNFSALRNQMKIIMEYWKNCSPPNHFLPTSA